LIWCLFVSIRNIPLKFPCLFRHSPDIPLILPALTWYTILIPAGQVVNQVWHLADRCQWSGIMGQDRSGVPVESGIHWEFHQMMADGDVPRW
jgi:hypothetical protein